tara:strand:+ start:204 stop:1880 length:1677 start_codon:yes stop_codon:yes gene_type:complete
MNNFALKLVFVVITSLIFGNNIKFKDQAEVVSLNFSHDHGGSGKYFYVESMGAGVCMFDFDNDGDLDVYFPQGSPLPGYDRDRYLENKLFRNDGTTWVDVTKDAGVGDTNYGMGCACGDYDNDGAIDLYVTNYGDDVFYKNNNDGTFTDVTTNIGIKNEQMGMSAAFFDSDNDGWLDLYVTNYVEYSIYDNPECTSPMQYPKQGELFARSYCDPDVFLGVADKFFYNKKGKFIDRSNRSGIGRYKLRGLGVVPCDIDNDGDTDIYVANDKDMNLIFKNNGKGRFNESALIMGAGYNGNGLAEAGMGVDVGDIDRDGWIDIFVTNYSGETNTLYLNQFGNMFLDETNQRGLGKPSIHFLAFGTKFVDLDLDGWLDLYVANGHVIDNINLFNSAYEHLQHDQIYLNNSSGRFEDVTLSIGGDLLNKAVGRGLAVGDIDNDGDIDLIVSNNNGRANMLINEGKPKNNWIGIHLEGISCNRQAIGSKVKVISGTLEQVSWVNPSGSYLSSNDNRLIFGIDDYDIVDTIEIHWPGFDKQSFKSIKPNRYYKIIQGEPLAVIKY